MIDPGTFTLGFLCGWGIALIGMLTYRFFYDRPDDPDEMEYVETD